MDSPGPWPVDWIYWHLQGNPCNDKNRYEPKKCQIQRRQLAREKERKSEQLLMQQAKAAEQKRAAELQMENQKKIQQQIEESKIRDLREKRERIRKLERELRKKSSQYYKAWKQGTQEAKEQELEGYARRSHIGGTRGVAYLRFQIDEIIRKLHELDPKNSDSYDVPELKY